MEKSSWGYADTGRVIRRRDYRPQEGQSVWAPRTIGPATPLTLASETYFRDFVLVEL